MYCEGICIYIPLFDYSIFSQQLMPKEDEGGIRILYNIDFEFNFGVLHLFICILE